MRITSVLNFEIEKRGELRLLLVVDNGFHQCTCEIYQNLALHTMLFMEVITNGWTNCCCGDIMYNKADAHVCGFFKNGRFLK